MRQILHGCEFHDDDALAAKHAVLHDAGKRRRGIGFTLSVSTPAFLPYASHRHRREADTGNSAHGRRGHVTYLDCNAEWYTEHHACDRHFGIAQFHGETAIGILCLLISDTVERDIFLCEFRQGEIQGDAFGCRDLRDLRRHGKQRHREANQKGRE